jgi:hypothetical protein
MLVNGERQVAGRSIAISPVLSDPRTSVGFDFSQGHSNCRAVCFPQSLVLAENRHDGNGFRSGEREVVQVPGATPGLTFRVDTISTFTLTEELAVARIESLTDAFKLLPLYRTLEP